MILYGQRSPNRDLAQADTTCHVLQGLLANGHVLLEGLPGLAKTRTVKALANHLDAKMRRIQFTPHVLPSDITGGEILQQTTDANQIKFQPGPLFGNVILADEINRAPAKVQAALLEAMEERQITVAHRCWCWRPPKCGCRAAWCQTPGSPPRRYCLH